MVGRAANVTAGGTRGLGAAGAVEPSGRAAAATVGTAEVPRVRGCGTGGGDQSRKIGRSRRLPSSGGDRSREMGRSPRLLCSGSGMGRGMGRSRLLSPEPREEGCMAALGHGDGGSGGAFLRSQRGDACLLLSEGPRRVLKSRGGSGGVSVQSGELGTEGSNQPSMLGGSQVDRVPIGDGPRGVGSRYPGAGESFSTSRRETLSIVACCAGSRLAHMGARCPRWGGGPSLEVGKVRGIAAVGRNPGVRPVPEPVLARRSVGGIDERSKSGPGAEGGGEVVLMVTLGDDVAEVLGEDMLREARNGARGEKSRGGGTRSVKGGLLATSVVTRGAVVEIR